MKDYPAPRLTAIALVCTATALMGVDVAGAQAGDIDEVVSPNGVAPKLELTAAQRSAIYQAVSQDKSKVAPSRFPATLGGEVPPMIEIHMLPDDILAYNPVTKLYKFTRVEDRVVLVDPTHMCVIAVIGPHRDE